MGLQYQAKTAKQKALVQTFIDTFGEDIDATIEFSGLKVIVTDKDGDATTYPNYQSFTSYLDSHGTNGTPEPEPTQKEAKEEAQADKKAAAATAKAKAQEEKAQQKVADDQAKVLTDLQSLVDDMANTAKAERVGEIEKNEARWRKGEHVMKLDDIAAKAKQYGIEVDGQDLGSRQSILEYASDAVTELLREQGVVEIMSRMSPTEMTFAKSAYEAFARYHGGTSGTFDLMDQLDENGHALEDADGNPYTKQIGELALNKAYHLSRFASPGNRDRLLSFAYAYDEGTVKAFAKLLKERGADTNIDLVDELLDSLYENRVKVEPEDGGEPVEMNPDAKRVRDWVRSQTSTVKSDVRSIKVDEGFYHGRWLDVLRYGSVVWKWLGNDVNQTSGYMPNTVLLERLLEPFNPADHGFDGIVGILIASGDMTEAQAKQFLEEHADFDPGQD